MITVAASINTFAAYDNIKDIDEQSAIETVAPINKTEEISHEPLRYVTSDTQMVIATPVKEGWTVSVSASQIKNTWENTDDFDVVDFSNADMSFDDENILTMTFNNVDYENGVLAVILFHNKTQDEYEALQIDFSETGVPTFQSETQRNRVTSGRRKLRSASIVIPVENELEIDDAKQQYNKNVEPPTDIILAESQGSGYFSDVMVKDINKLGDTASVNYISPGSRTTTTTSSTVFSVRNTLNVEKYTYTDPFEAIQYVCKNRKTNWKVTQDDDDDTVIFQYNPNNHNTFYLFQFGNYYGTATSESEVKAWTSYALYSHAVRADGIYGSNTTADRTSSQPYAHSYKSALRTPEQWALEGNTGAYVYKKSISNNGYKSISSKVLLSQAKLKFDSNTPTNAYVYMSSNSNHASGSISCDIGLLSAPTYNGKWYLIANRNNKNGSTTTSQSGMQTFYDTPIVTSTYSGGQYTPKHDIYLYYTYGDGTVYCQVQNVTTGVAQEGYVDDSRFNTDSPNICLMTGTSLVPDVKDSTDTHVASDIKCGAYLKNVIWSENKIYKQSLWQGTAYSFAGNNSSTTNYLLCHSFIAVE